LARASTSNAVSVPRTSIRPAICGIISSYLGIVWLVELRWLTEPEWRSQEHPLKRDGSY
jgi:hypothetical protein